MSATLNIKLRDDALLNHHQLMYLITRTAVVICWGFSINHIVGIFLLVINANRSTCQAQTGVHLSVDILFCVCLCRLIVAFITTPTRREGAPMMYIFAKAGVVRSTARLPIDAGLLPKRGDQDLSTVLSSEYRNRGLFLWEGTGGQRGWVSSIPSAGTSRTNTRSFNHC